MQIKFFLISVLLIVVILGFGVSIKAQTSDIQALILQIKAQIAQLQAQLQNMLAQQQGGRAWCHTFNTNIGINNNNINEIQALQTVLEKEGIRPSITEENPAESKPLEYNQVMANLVSVFQEKYAFEILAPYNLKYGTGFVGSSTRAKLNALYGCKTYCAQDAKQCPDGSYVGRTGPNCEFAQCPSVNTNNCPTINCFWDPCPGRHLPDANGCVNCSTACF